MAGFEFALVLAAKSAGLLLATAGAAFAARRASAAFRHLIWTTGLVATLALPAVPAIVPGWPAWPAARQITPAPLVSPDPAPAAMSDTPVSAASPSAPARITAAPATSVAAPRARPAIDWADLLPILWALGVLGVGLWMLIGAIGVFWLGRTAVPLETPEWIATVEEVLADRSFRRSLRFLESDRIRTPCTWGVIRPTILVPTAGGDWSSAERRDVIVHELAHVARFDCLTHFLSRAVCALHWFNPLVWLAARSARVAREQACDDAVLAAGELPSAYADLLLKAAGRNARSSFMPVAALAMARRSHLGDRLIAVLDPDRRRRSLDGRTLVLASAGALGLLLPLGAMTSRAARTVPRPERTPVTEVRAPEPRAFPARAPDGPRAPRVVLAQDPDRCVTGARGRNRTFRMASFSVSGSGNMTDGKGNTTVAWTGVDCTVAVKIRGTPSFTEGEDDVAAISPGGRFDLTAERGDTERRYQVTAGQGGSLDRRYSVDGKEAPLDAAARRWIQASILDFFRQSGFNAAERIARIRKAAGFVGVLHEIDEIGGDGTRARYLELALAEPNLPAADAGRLLERTSAMGSDGARAQVLSAIPLGLLTAPEVVDRYIEAVRGIESDGDKTMVLIRLVRQRPAVATLGTIMGLAKSIQSDGDRTNLLRTTVDVYPGAASLPPSFYEAAKGIESDGDLATLLLQAIRSGKVEPASCGRFLGLVSEIGSDGDRSSVLIAAMDAMPVAKLFESHSRLFSINGAPILYVDGLPVALAACIDTELRLAREIGSDGDKAAVLIHAARRDLIRTPELRQAYLAAARSIGSDGDREAALRALGEL